MIFSLLQYFKSNFLLFFGLIISYVIIGIVFPSIKYSILKMSKVYLYYICLLIYFHNLLNVKKLDYYIYYFPD